MGVKDLWYILSPLGERKPLYELQGKVVAIDLSCWVVDSQNVTDNNAQPKMYLRNLYFRTVYLLMQGISPVFVLEGKAPALKHNTMEKRRAIRTGVQENKENKKGKRTRFNRILAECQRMLKLMGLACVQGTGEAEAMCAYLNADGLVDGCISQDSDCFLYGAKVVYRNFTMSANAKNGTTGSFVDEYSIEKIEKVLDIGRNKMIALALLCGCDYDNGVNGVGKEAAMKFFEVVKDEDVLERMKSWKTDKTFVSLEAALSNKKLCSNCGHEGNPRLHAKSGCSYCDTIVNCYTIFKENKGFLVNEIAIRKKALTYEHFPNQELIDEFLVRKDSTLPKVELRWKQPRVKQLIDFMNDCLGWEPQYAFEKVLPLATRWQLLHLPDITPDNRLSMKDLFIPEKIKKIRNIRSTPSYEIIWKDESGVVQKIREQEFSETEDNENNDILQELTTIEPQHMVSRCYPEIIEQFENARNSKVKKRTAKPRADNANKANKNTRKVPQENGEPKICKKRTRRSKANKKLDDFVSKNQMFSLQDSFEQLSITPKRSKKDQISKNTNTASMDDEDETAVATTTKRKDKNEINKKMDNTINRLMNDLSSDDFMTDGEENELEMSAAVERVCSTKTFAFNSQDLTRILGQISEPYNNELSTNKENIARENTLLRFSRSRVEKPAQEQSPLQALRNSRSKSLPRNMTLFETSETDDSDISVVESDSEESMDENNTNESKTETNRSQSPDEFEMLDVTYVPINQRIQAEYQNKKINKIKVD